LKDGRLLLSDGGFQQSQRVEGDPLAGAIALLQRPGAGDKAAEPLPTFVLAGEEEVEKRDKASVASIAVGGQGAKV
jgi:hypothetical protein